MSARHRSALFVALMLSTGVLAAAVVVGAPQSAAADSAFDRPESPLIEMQVDAEGNNFWQVSPTRDSPYIATWERSEGVWSSVEEATAHVAQNAQCYIDAKVAYLNTFATYAEFEAAPSSLITLATATTPYSWDTDDPTALAAYAVCAENNEWATEQTTSTDTENFGQSIITISADQMGPGTHDLFIVDLQYAEGRSCAKNWPDGQAWSGYGCVPTFEVDEMTVAVGYEATPGTVLAGPVVDKATAFDESVFSSLPVMADGGAASTPAGSILPPVVPLLVTLLITLIFALLIAVPSALLESSRRRSTPPGSTTATPGSEG